MIKFLRWFHASLIEVIEEKLAIFETDWEVRQIYAIINNHWYDEYNRLIPATGKDRAVEHGVIHNG